MAEAVYLLSGGTVEFCRGEGAGRRAVLVSPGESVGMFGLITGTPSMVTATALTRVTAYRLGKADFRRSCAHALPWPPVWRNRPIAAKHGCAARLRPRK